MDLHSWLAFMAATFVVLVIPGPTILLVLSYALTQGKRVAVGMSLGVATGDFIAMTASLLGAGALVMASASLFTALKLVGAGYLIFLGISQLRAGPAALEAGETGAMPVGRIYRHAAVVTATNPKSIAFFIAFVPQFIAADRALAPQFAVMIVSFVTLATLNALAYALLADRLRARIRAPGVMAWLNRIGGSVLILLGLATATLRRA